MSKHGIPISCTARKVISSDFASFTFIMAMDESKYNEICYCTLTAPVCRRFKGAGPHPPAPTSRSSGYSIRPPKLGRSRTRIMADLQGSSSVLSSAWCTQMVSWTFSSKVWTLRHPHSFDDNGTGMVRRLLADF